MQNLGRGEGKQSVLLENSQLNIWGGVAITVVVWLGGGGTATYGLHRYVPQ